MWGERYMNLTETWEWNHKHSDASSILNATTITHLPTAEEYRESVSKTIMDFNVQWTEPKYQCPECGGGMCKDLTRVCTSIPPQYLYKCNKCGHIEYRYG